MRSAVARNGSRRRDFSFLGDALSLAPDDRFSIRAIAAIRVEAERSSRGSWERDWSCSRSPRPDMGSTAPSRAPRRELLSEPRSGFFPTCVSSADRHRRPDRHQTRRDERCRVCASGCSRARRGPGSGRLVRSVDADEAAVGPVREHRRACCRPESDGPVEGAGVAGQLAPHGEVARTGVGARVRPIPTGAVKMRLAVSVAACARRPLRSTTRCVVTVW